MTWWRVLRYEPRVGYILTCALQVYHDIVV